MEGEWLEYEYIDEEELAEPDFYVDQFYPTGGLQVGKGIRICDITMHMIPLRMTWKMTWAVVLPLSQSARSWSTASSRQSLMASSTWARSLYGVFSSELSHKLWR